MAALISATGPVLAAEIPRMTAHRGAGIEYDENTVGAVRQSYEMGVRAFEVDLRLTKDDKLVLLHDPTVDRTSNGKGSIEEMTLEEVRALRTKKNDEPIPTAEDLCAYLKDKPEAFLELEMKTTDEKVYPEERLDLYCKLLHEAASVLPKGRHVYISFDQRVLKAIRRLDPAAPIMLLTSKPTEETITEALALGSNRVAVKMDATPRSFVTAAKKAGLMVSGWTAASKADLKLAAALGFDTITTDLPSVGLE